MRARVAIQFICSVPRVNSISPIGLKTHIKLIEMALKEVIVAKIVSVVVLGLFAFIFGLLPIKLKKYFESFENDEGKKEVFELVITTISCFGAGVILTTCLTHMIPEANEYLNINIEKGTISNTGFPLVEILALAGFLLIYLVEEIVHALNHRWNFGGDEKQKESSSYEMGGGHSHGLSVDGVFSESHSFKAVLRAFIIILALGLHSLFEGIAIGLGRNSSDVWFLFIAIASHKFVIAFVIGMQFVVSGLTKTMIVTLISVFSCVSPAGIIIGLLVTYTGASGEESPEQSIATTVLNGLAAGTLLYVVFFEVLEKERAKEKNGLIQVGCIILGFLFMIMIAAIEKQTESHDDDDGALNSSSYVPYCNLNQLTKAPLTLDALKPLNFTCKNGVLTLV